MANMPWQILDHLDPETKYAYRVGYCPVEEEGDFFVAKTVLVPEYTATPEYGVLLQSTLDPTRQSADAGTMQATLLSAHGCYPSFCLVALVPYSWYIASDDRYHTTL